jgi:type 1 glutamine amidotransferase
MDKTMSLLVISLFAAAWCLASQAAAEVTKEVEAQMLVAAPEKPTVKPAKPRKLLVFTQVSSRCWVHSSIPYAAKALEIMGKKTGAYEATVTNDPAVFEMEKLKQYDAVFLDNNAGDCMYPHENSALQWEIGELKKKLTDNNNPPKPEEAVNINKQISEAERKLAALPPTRPLEERHKKALLDFVKSGRGLAGTHAATECYTGNKEYDEMLGGRDTDHPYFQHVAKLDDPKHPCTAVFGGKPFEFNDEMYAFSPMPNNGQPYSRDKVRVLLSIDVDASKAKDPNFNPDGGKRPDHDYAISWVKSYGHGRVFYCSYGHNDSSWSNPTILRFFLDGIQFAMGDLKGDTTPVPLKPKEAH